MRLTWRGRSGMAIWIGGLSLALMAHAQEKISVPVRAPLILHARVREPAPAAKGAVTDPFVIEEKILQWIPTKTAIIICDMWNQHWCQGATRRVAELAPAMNRAITAA